MFAERGLGVEDILCTLRTATVGGGGSRAGSQDRESLGTAGSHDVNRLWAGAYVREAVSTVHNAPDARMRRPPGHCQPWAAQVGSAER